MDDVLSRYRNRDTSPTVVVIKDPGAAMPLADAKMTVKGNGKGQRDRSAAKTDGPRAAALSDRANILPRSI